MTAPPADPVEPPTAPEPHVLVVEDDGETRRLLVRLLRENGHRATGARDGAEMEAALAAGLAPDLLLLDVMLPGRSGTELLRDLRRPDGRWATMPVVMLTARGTAADRAAGLEGGADDYVAKPFDRRELLARVRAVLRRTSGGVPVRRGRRARFAGWTLDTATRELRSAEGVVVDLSGAEYDLLSVLLDHPQRALSRERLLELSRNRVSIAASDRAVDVQVSRLRGKLEAGDDARAVLKSVRGVGYVFTPDVEWL